MGDTFRSDNLSPVRGPVPAWTADPLTAWRPGDDGPLTFVEVTDAEYHDLTTGRVRPGWLVVAALLGIAAGLLVPR